MTRGNRDGSREEDKSDLGDYASLNEEDEDLYGEDDRAPTFPSDLDDNNY